jgi:hypothetical protein
MPATISTSERLDKLEEQLETVLQLIPRLIDHVLPPLTQTSEDRRKNARALLAWPNRVEDDDA